MLRLLLRSILGSGSIAHADLLSTHAVNKIGEKLKRCFLMNTNSVNGNCAGSQELARSLLPQWLLPLFFFFCIKAKIRTYYLSRGLLSWSGIVRGFCRVLTLKEATNYRASSSSTALLTQWHHNLGQRQWQRPLPQTNAQTQPRASVWPLCQSLANAMNYPEIQVGCTQPGPAAAGTKAQASERVEVPLSLSRCEPKGEQLCWTPRRYPTSRAAQEAQTVARCCCREVQARESWQAWGFRRGACTPPDLGTRDFFIGLLQSQSL